MKTPITDAAEFAAHQATRFHYKQDLLVDASLARRLELDRAALMEICNRLVELDLNGTDDLLVRFIVIAHQNSAAQALAAARANFPNA
jgi:hypothetical protein